MGQKKITLQTIATHLGCNVSTAHGLVKKLDIDRTNTTLDEIRFLYIQHLRKVVADRGGDSAFDLTVNRTRLAKEQADRLAIKNEITRGQLASVAYLELILANTSAKAAGLFDALPGMMKRHIPHLTEKNIDLVRAEIAKVVALFEAMTLRDSLEEIKKTKID